MSVVISPSARTEWAETVGRERERTKFAFPPAARPPTVLTISVAPNILDGDDRDDFLFAAAVDDPAYCASVRRARLRRRRHHRWLAVFMVAAVVLAPAAWALRGKGVKTRVLHRLFPGVTAWMSHPSVESARPGPGEWGVAPDAFVACEVRLPNAGRVIDAGTIHDGSVRLLGPGRTPVEARVNTSAAGDVIVLKPVKPLELNTQYRVEVLPALKDTGGASFERFASTFTTAASATLTTFPVAFERVRLPEATGHPFTGAAVGPDRKLYACTGDGRVFRFAIRPDGTLGRPQIVMSPQSTGGEPRLITGIAFDPASTEDEPVLWVSHGQCGLDNADDWTGKIGRLSGTDLRAYEDVVVGLPRALRDHLNNQPAFGPDGALYVAVASNSAMGAADRGWGDRPERLLSAAILRVDVRAIAGGPPVDVRTEGVPRPYDPYAPGAPVTVYARGVRNAFDLLWHRDGRLYAPVNGSAAGGNVPPFQAPDGPRDGMTNVRFTEPDTLLCVRPGAYYGHPVPARGESVLQGGNPTDGPDPFEVPQYPPGTSPDPDWHRPVFDFGRHLSPCGLIEYRAAGAADPAAALDGKILVTRYSGGKDVVALTPGGPHNGYAVAEAILGIDGFTDFDDPLDVCQDPVTGYLYVVEFGGQRVTLLRPKPGAESKRVYRQVPGATGNRR